MIRYGKCPRCDLNYIDLDKQEYCDVCVAELKGAKLQFADLDDEDYEELENEAEQTELCPVCGVNKISYGEKMCESCRQENRFDEEEEEEVDIEKDEEWKNYLDEDDGDADLTVDDETLQEELDAELEEEEEEEENEDDFFDDDIDSLSDLEDDEYDDDDDDFDDDDDDDF